MNNTQREEIEEAIAKVLKSLTGELAGHYYDMKALEGMAKEER